MDDVTTRKPATDPSMELLGDLEERLQALKQWQKESSEHAARIEQREQDAMAERAALDAEAERLAADRKAAAEERVELEQRRSGLENERSGLSADEAVLDAEKQRLEAEAQRIQAERTELDEARAQLSERSTEAHQLDERAARLGREAEELAVRVGALDERAAGLEARESELAGRGEELDRRSGELDAFREELDTELQRLSDLEAELNTRASGLDDREARLDGDTQRETDEQLAALTATLEEREVELNRSRRQLDEAGAEVLQLKEQLNHAVAGVAAEAAAPPAVANPGFDVEAMQAELDKRAHNLKRAKRKILELQEEVRSAADANGESAIFSSADLDPSAANELRMKLETREQELAFARKELESGVVETAKLRTRVNELLKRAERPGDAPDHAARASELDAIATKVAADRARILERKSQLKSADALIKSRREKVRKFISEFRATRGPSQSSRPAVDPAAVEALEAERATLREVKRFLQASETVMVKRWALQKAASIAATLVIAVAAASAVSWTAAGVLAKPLYQATLTMHIESHAEEEPLPPGVWLSGYGRDLFSDSVLGEIQNQLGQRDLRLAGTVEGLRTRLSGVVAVAGDRDALEVTFTDPDPALVAPVLDAVGRGLLINHMAKDRRAGRMSDTASLTSEAVRRDRPVKDDRFRVFGMILAAFAGLALLAAIPARFMAGRARPVLPEGAVPELATIDHPSPLVADAMKAAHASEANDEDEVMRPIFRF